MAEIEIKVGGRPYRMSCEDGQEDHLRAVAGHLNAEAEALKANFGNLPELRLLLMAGVMVADKLETRTADLRDAEGALQHMIAKGGGAEPEAAPAKAKAKPDGKAAAPDLFGDAEELAALKARAAELEEAREAAVARAAMAEAAAEEAQARLGELEERASAAERRAADAEDAAESAKSAPNQGLVKALNAKLADAEARAHALTREVKAVEDEAAAAVRAAAERVRSATAELTEA